MDPQLKEHITAKTTWSRGLYILLFAIVFNIAEILVVAVVLFQFLSTLLTGNNNQQLLRLGRQLSSFVRQLLMFVTYNSEEKPFPFGPWPNMTEDTALQAPAKKKAAKKTTTKKTDNN
ncbi:MAG: DUF4389 domain-containing protein [Acidiferrobacterales bacterium]